MKNAIDAGSERGRHLRNRFRRKITTPLPLAAGQHGVKFRQGRGAANPAERAQRERAYFRRVHPANRVQPGGRGEGLPDQSSRRGQVAIKLRGLRRLAGFGGVNGGDAMVFRFGQSDPEIEPERFGKSIAPIFA